MKSNHKFVLPFGAIYFALFLVTPIQSFKLKSSSTDKIPCSTGALGSKPRCTRGLWKGQPEYNYFKSMFSAIDSHQGVSGKPHGYEKQFEKVITDAQKKKGYKGQIDDWGIISGLGATSYKDAVSNAQTLLETAYRQGTEATKQKAAAAIQDIQNIVNHRKIQMDKYPNPDAGHITAYNSWRDRWADWHEQFGTAVLPAPPARMPYPTRNPNNNRQRGPGFSG